MRTLFIHVGQVVCLLTAFALARTAFPSEECAELAKKDPVGWVKYLERPRASTESRCVNYAIRELGRGHHAAATELLIEYLDYPPSFSDLGNHFPPAMNALFSIGRPAIAPLVSALAKNEISDKARENAILTLFAIHRRHYV
jgi:hypothetical protein